MQHVHMERFDVNLLAQISEGYSGGAIQSAIKRTLTPRRQDKLERQPLQESGGSGDIPNPSANPSPDPSPNPNPNPSPSPKLT